MASIVKNEKECVICFKSIENEASWHYPNNNVLHHGALPQNAERVHAFCVSCLREWMRLNASCPTCRLSFAVPVQVSFLAAAGRGDLISARQIWLTHRGVLEAALAQAIETARNAGLRNRVLQLQLLEDLVAPV